ncbi:MAG: helix-turn-helix transcriptional regulator [Polaromonas sp.]|uniref:helix-turn-helix domain-containing protein n=1 Tax=Polaromonas sp. TaxID=1869339 RepID=UPI0025D63123|nr:helix-turn-helix transcriptional regulator [Polaromonas sp.]MBI2724673.1 helix-turn-helix transcriptional regulator [Polaromonas sp.]
MQSLQEIGTAVALHRRSLGLRQGEVAAKAGIASQTLSRFERGHVEEFGTRKLLAVLAVLGMGLDIIDGSGEADAL